MDRKSLKKIFDQDIIVDDIIRNLSAALPCLKFIPNKTVIIFDEIQECANARATIKPFMLDSRFDIIATGSLIDLRKKDIFKVYVVDSGLFTAMLGQDTYNEILNEDFGIYKGALYENMVVEALVKNNQSLYYFSKDSGLEIDFISKIGNELFAIESKAKNGTAKSLKTVLEGKEYSITKGIKLINGNIGEMNNIYTIPLYMAFLLK